MPRQKRSKTRPKSPIQTSKLHLRPAPIEPFRIGGRDLYLKRDDLIHPLLSGNKYRKLHAFVHTPPETIDTVLSYGGIQSNAMLSIAALCRFKGWRFEYTAKSVPKHLKADPKGNYRQALELGMQLTEVPPAAYDEAVLALQERCGSGPEKTVLIPQGGAGPSAKYGVYVLAEEISAWRKQKGIEKLTVATPSGTGTTAAYLAQALPECRVITVAAVGDTAYLQRQIEKLMPLPKNLILLSAKYRFGSLHDELLKMYETLKESGVEFDLIYAPVMWLALLENTESIEGELLYVHSGGVSGNETMLARYARRRLEL